LPIYQKFFGENFFIPQEVSNFVSVNNTKHLKIDKMETSRKVGEIHKNGKWAWTEYAEGKFDWRTIKTENVKVPTLQDLLKKYETEKSQEIFWGIYQERLNDKSFKLTNPQQEVIDRLKSGSVIVVINEHHASGGDWTWDARSGGKIYRAFWNTMSVVLKGSGHITAPKGFVISEREFNNRQS